MMLNEFSRSQETYKHTRTLPKKAEQICFSVPNDITREISQVDGTATIRTKRG